MTKRVRGKKRSKAVEDKRKRLLSELLNKWVYVKSNYGDEENYIFLYHRLVEPGKTSKIEQLLLSHDEIQDGVYLITDYTINMVYDHNHKKEIVELKPKKFDKKIGFDADEFLVKNFDELKQKLIGAKYLTEEEFLLYCQSEKKLPGLNEIFLNFDDFS
ncbi:hypothetical protein IMZ31_20785 (plasmid) [Pontibacillus sp. ALD_SL1]|uniref:hypothetical protein n=1 Tax=Pontibacillus sp. ALD_SL1 TaxID=2777185 RepID=UPI001A9786E5|nr:hypothetical protein [Pontibacillus sp. ALD_SL1]QST02986.1 hypothetical protein IMZ31_20785 [Pontibacillus sp. ALD_SL1]